MQKSIHSADYEHFLVELRRLRKDAGLNQTQLGERLGEDQSFVSKSETGIRRLDVVELRRWTMAVGIGLGEFTQRLEERLERHVRASPARGRR